MLITSTYACGGGQASDPEFVAQRIRLLHDSAGSNLLGHTITSSRSSHFDGTQLHECDFNTSCIACAIDGKPGSRVTQYFGVVIVLPYLHHGLQSEAD
ncbi:hypothetical protein TNCV_800151 [Trichonephila clavipes]|nr:hypothetical protein TNCV_800151 [Trichonephila clavipes]